MISYKWVFTLNCIWHRVTAQYKLESDKYVAHYTIPVVARVKRKKIDRKHENMLQPVQTAGFTKVNVSVPSDMLETWEKHSWMLPV